MCNECHMKWDMYIAFIYVSPPLGREYIVHKQVTCSYMTTCNSLVLHFVHLKSDLLISGRMPESVRLVVVFPGIIKLLSYIYLCLIAR